jgi:signal transduction histidine kinase
MTEMPVRRESLLRALWRATKPGAALAIVGLLVFQFLFLAWLVGHDHTLVSVASGCRTQAFIAGMGVLFLRFFGPGWGLRRRSFTFFSSTPVVIGDPPLQDPGALAVAEPILAGFGAANLGYAFGLNVILLSSHEEPLARVASLAMCLLIVLGLGTAMYLVTDSTRRFFAWTQQVAASAATAEADADRARITALQAQMNPHFLFNALNTVASLVGTDGARARRTVESLSGMLRHTLERSTQPLTTVEEELQFVRDYLDIERERFGSRLQVTYSIDPETASLAVPTMSLQPLVENAIKHAVTNRLEGGHIQIAASRRVEGLGGGLRLSVEDDGPGFARGSEDGTGLGNLRARLRSLYGPAAELVTETMPTGARVSVTIPPSPSAWQAPPSPAASAGQAG